MKKGGDDSYLSPGKLASLWGVDEAVFAAGVMRRTVKAGGTNASVALNAAQVKKPPFTFYTFPPIRSVSFRFVSFLLAFRFAFRCFFSVLFFSFHIIYFRCLFSFNKYASLFIYYFLCLCFFLCSPSSPSSRLCFCRFPFYCLVSCCVLWCFVFTTYVFVFFLFSVKRNVFVLCLVWFVFVLCL